MVAPDKLALVRALRDDLARSVTVLTSAANDAREAATHEEAKPENDKDTRAVEAAYLAGAQAERVRELERAGAALAALELRAFGPGVPISSAALVALEHDGVALYCFVAPQGGGLRARVDGVEVQVVTPQSAMGRALLGKQAGDVIEVATPLALRAYEITDVW